ncbi:MAG TPA: hypothetical protein VE860_25565 [Chthoniobacterales bacterium]|nr:hypothetical protein [Chthoniobacterales bacterium]
MKSLLFILLLFVTVCGLKAAEPVVTFTITKADGVQATYEILVPDEETDQGVMLAGESAAARQQNAGVAALAWAKQFYGAHDVYLRSVQRKESGPVPYYLATFDGEIAGARQVFFAVVLESGAIVQPIQLAPAISQ